MKPADFERNGERIYSRGSIQRVEVKDPETEETSQLWQYDEAILTKTEFDSLMAGNSGFVTAWNDATRNAERRAKYERMDSKVKSLERTIRVCYANEDAAGAAEAEAKLLVIHEYCQAVTATQDQKGFPETVTYPDEPDV